MATIKMKQLSQIPHLDVENIGGRTISCLSFYVKAAWSVWIIPENANPIELKPVEAGECFYFAEAPARETDICFPFLNFMVQRASLPTVVKSLSGLKDDIYNLSASLRKIRFLYQQNEHVGRGVSRMIVSEVEYIFSTCRSMFDLLQEIVCKLWHSVKLHDETKKKRPLPETFSKMVLNNNELRTPEIIAQHFKIPMALAECYGRHSKFFATLRQFRDRVTHGGNSIETVYVGERDFMVSCKLPPFSHTQIWENADGHPNHLYDLSPALSAILCQTLETMNDFGQALEHLILWPPPLVPNMAYFMRGYFNEHLLEAIQDYERRVLSNVGQS